VDDDDEAGDSEASWRFTRRAKAAAAALANPLDALLLLRLIPTLEIPRTVEVAVWLWVGCDAELYPRSLGEDTCGEAC